MRIAVLFCICSLLLIQSLLPVSARGQILPVSNYNTDNGLPDATVLSVTQDSSGFIWIGTWNGPARFDSRDFHTGGIPPRLAGIPVRAALTSSNGQIWLGTSGNGLFTYEDNDWVNFTAADGLPGDDIRSIGQAQNGEIWITTQNGAGRFDGRQWYGYSSGDGLQNDSCVGLLVEKDKVWVGTTSGPAVYESGVWQAFELPADNTGLAVSDIFRDSDGGLWFCTLTDGLYYLNDGDWKHYSVEDGLPGNWTRRIIQDRFGTIWVAAEGGVAEFDGSRWITLTMRNGLSGERVRTLHEDMEGNIWIGTVGNGLDKLQGSAFQQYTYESGLLPEWVNAVERDVAGNLWFATYGGGAICLRDNRMEYYRADHGPGDDHLLDVISDKRGGIWFATQNAGVCRFDGSRWEHWTRGHGLPSQRVNCLFLDDEGKIWAGTASGAARLDGNRWKPFALTDGGREPAVFAIMRDRDGNLWFATDSSGAVRFDGKSLHIFNSGMIHGLEDIRHIYQDGDGNLWFSTSCAGVYRWDGSGFLHLSVSDSLADDWVCFTVQYGDKYYFGTENGVACWDGNSTYTLGVQDGLAGERMAIGGFMLEEQAGCIWFCSTGGVTRFLPDRYNPAGIPPPVYIRDAVTLRADTVLPGQKLKYDNNYLQFDFQALRFSSPGSIRYRYLLEGIDDDWRYTEENSVNYAYLTPGDYTFKVTAVDSRGLSSQTPAQLSFTISPAFWQTIWFQLSAMLVFILFCYLYFRTWSQDRLKEYSEEQRRNLERLVEFMPVMVVAVDEYRRIVLWNNECERVTGYLKEDVMGNPDVLKMLIPDENYRNNLIKKAASLKGNFRDLRIALTIKDKSERTISWSSGAGVVALPGYDSWAVGIDITDQLADDTRLRENERMLKEAHEIALLGSYRFEFPDGQVTWSDTTYALIGWDKKLGPPSNEQYFQLVHPEDRQIFTSNLAANARKLEPFECKYRLITPAGELKYMHSHCKPVKKEDGKIAVTGTIQDVTRLVQTIEQLNESQRQHRTLLEYTPDVVSLLDNQGRHLYISPSIKKYLDVNPGEIHGKAVDDIISDPQLADMLLSKIRYALDSGQPVMEEFGGEFLPGQVVFRWHLIPEKADNGDVVNLVSIAQDITAIRQLEHQQQKASKLESLGVLAGGIAHDFNNVLTSIMGNLSLALASETVTDEVKQMLLKAETSCNRASELTNRLLVFSRGGVPSRKILELEDTVKTAVEKALDGADRIDCTFDFPDDIHRVHADPRQLSRAFVNLAENARHAMPDGGKLDVTATNVTLADNNQQGLKAGGYVVISLRDSGVGIADDLKASIFDPYFTTRPDASGLGLTTAYFIAGRHGGTLEVDSAPGNGATFSLYLPAAGHVQAEPVVKAAKTTESALARILLMDDEPALLDVSGRVIELLGYRVATAVDGEHALKLYREARESGDSFDLVILDITVPGGMGGVETMKLLREMDPDVKAIVSSGYSNDPVMSNYSAYGFIGVLPKPYRVNDLKDMILHIIGR